MRPILAPWLIATALAFGATAMPATAQESGYTLPADATLLSVSAQADATRTPDVAGISAGVVTQAADAGAAMQDNAARMARVMDAIKAAGIAAKDVQTGGIGVSPQYRYADNQPPAITGYQASNTVNVKVRDIARLGKVLDALVASGANDINGPNFQVDQPDAAYDEARQAALAKARARADMYAKTLGLHVRRIVSISDGAASGPVRPMPMMAMAKAGRAADTPVAPGETTLGASVDVVFELGR